MGIFSALFGSSKPVNQPPQLTTIFPSAGVSKINSGILPTITVDKIVLGVGEVCHYVDLAAIVTEKTYRKSSHLGGSYHIWKGFTLHTGDTTSAPLTEPEYTKGVFFVTNKRIVFVASKYGFDQKISKLTASTPYSDAIDLQFGNKTYILLLPDGTTANKVIKMIV